MTEQGDLGLSIPQTTLWHGDCLEEMKNIPDNSVDMVLTDPP
jgi:DNA modification methylase